MKRITLKASWMARPEQVILQLTKYAWTGTPCLMAFSPEGAPFAKLSILPTEVPPQGLIAIKDYSENMGFLDQLIDQGIVSEPEYWLHQGFVEIPACKLLWTGGEG